MLSRFDANRLKVQLKLSVNRLKMLQQKKNALNLSQRREIATLLERGKEESARIRVEFIIREDYNMEAMEMMEIYCEMLLARFGLVEQMKNLDPSIEEATLSLIYAAPRAEAKELLIVRDLLLAKYGRELHLDKKAASDNTDGVNERLIEKMRVKVPDPKLVTRYLQEIARNYNVPWGNADEDISLDSALIGSGDSTFENVSAPPQAMPNGSAAHMPAKMPLNNALPYPDAAPPYPTDADVKPPYPSDSQPPILPTPTQPPPFAYSGYPPSAASASMPPQQPSGVPDSSPFDDMFPSVPSGSPKGPSNGGSGSGSGGGGDVSSSTDDDAPDFDALTKRFEALKRRQ